MAFLVVLFGLLPPAVRAQSPAVVWSNLISGSYGWYGGAGVAADRQDNFYYAGNFATQFFPIGNQTLTNQSNPYSWNTAQNGFLAKFSKAGDYLWVRQIGGEHFDEAYACAVDANGNVFVTGDNGSTNLVLDGAVLTNEVPYTSSCFLIKYDSQGNLLWARQSVGNLPLGTLATGMSVAVDAGGDSWVAGSFSSSNLVFGTNVLVNPDFSESAPVGQDFLVKYSSAGDVLWAQTIAVNDPNGDTFPVVGADTNGNAFLCSEFYGVGDAGHIPVTNTAGDSEGLLLAKFDPAGNVLWAEQAAHGGGMYPTTAAVDLQGNCRIAGQYWDGAAVFPSNTLSAPVENYNGLIAKFDSAGNFLWACAQTNQYSAGAAVDAIGNCYFVASGPNSTTSKYATDGTLLWSTNSLGLDGNVVVAADPAGTLFIVGGTDGSGYVYSAVQLSGPTLNIQPAGNQIAISWFTNEVGLNLESASSLSGP